MLIFNPDFLMAVLHTKSFEQTIDYKPDKKNRKSVEEIIVVPLACAQAGCSHT